MQPCTAAQAAYVAKDLCPQLVTPIADDNAVCYLAGFNRAAVQWLLQKRSEVCTNLTSSRIPPSTTVAVFEENVKQLIFSQCNRYLIACISKQIAAFVAPSGQQIWS